MSSEVDTSKGVSYFQGLRILKRHGLGKHASDYLDGKMFEIAARDRFDIMRAVLN